jgi:hypothetical protein
VRRSAKILCVPHSYVACSTKIVLEWDEAFKNMNDPSGRVGVANVHDDIYLKCKRTHFRVGAVIIRKQTFSI